MDNIKDRLVLLNNMKEIKRGQKKKDKYRNNVMEHSFLAIYFLDLMFKSVPENKENLRLYKQCVQHAMLHDAGEVYSHYVPMEKRKKYTDLKKELDAAGQIEVKEIFYDLKEPDKEAESIMELANILCYAEEYFRNKDISESDNILAARLEDMKAVKHQIAEKELYKEAVDILRRIHAGYNNRAFAKNMLERIDTLYGMKDIKRWGKTNQAKSRNNLMEHSFFMFYFLDIMFQSVPEDKENLKLYKQCIQYATLHDIGEVFMGDIAHDMKKKYPSVKQKSDEAEDAEVKEVFYDIKKPSKIVKAIVKLTDILSAAEEALREIYLENKNPKFDSAILISHEDLKEQEDKLKDHKQLFNAAVMIRRNMLTGYDYMTPERGRDVKRDYSTQTKLTNFGISFG
ncbi:MAG: HD domain-containing protein [Alphaproteobacteria bacterium]|nr:HD domain-containing protein [Alphaproteobacteria bacterium]